MSNVCIINPKQHIQDCIYVSDYEFTSGAKVPIYDVPNIPSLNQIVGYVKYINRDSGAVYYRGQSKLHPTMCPSLFHGLKSARARQKAQASLNKQIYTLCRFGFVIPKHGLYGLNQLVSWHLQVSVHVYPVNTRSFTALVGLDVMNSGHNGDRMHHGFRESCKCNVLACFLVKKVQILLQVCFV